MVDIRNTEIKTVSQIATSDTSALTLGGQVPAGMKRWVTFMMYDTATTHVISDCDLYLASVGVSNPSKASLMATGNRKYRLPMDGLDMSQSSKTRPVMLPQSGPDPDNPLFSIAAGKWLGVFSSLTTANVMIQYFDE